MIKRPENLYAHYHARVYFGPATVAQARALCQEAGKRFKITVGRVHERRAGPPPSKLAPQCAARRYSSEREVGPHPHWSCQLAFGSTEFDRLIPWLEQHRKGLDVLVHGVSGDDLADHTTHASWLGHEAALKLDMFKR